jgi:hypothetical protein
MAETLLTPSSIKLFGRVVKGIKYDKAHAGITTGLGDNKFLQKQLEAGGKDNDPNFARIYAFSFEGAYYPIPRPPIFLVHGPGHLVGNWVAPSTVDQSGVAGREWDFSGNYPNPQPDNFPPPHPIPAPPHPRPDDLVYWEYEKGDFSLRLDLDAGPFEQILLQMALRGAGVSGAGVSGAGVSGAGVSGAGVSGAGVSGAGVSGAGLRR